MLIKFLRNVILFETKDELYRKKIYIEDIYEFDY